MAILTNGQNFPIRKSAGGYTYRNVNGHTVVSRKITSTNSCSEKQRIQQQSFAQLQRITAELAPSVETGFDGITYNIRRRAFMSANKALQNFIRQDIENLKDIPPLSCLLHALRSPLFFGNIVASEGTINSRSHFYWDADGNPAGDILLPLPFEASDRVKLVFAVVYEIAGEEQGLVRSCSFTLGDRIVDTLAYPNFLVFDSHTVPQLKDFVKLPYSSVIKGACMAAVVHRGDTCSTAYFGLVEG